jgi:hypothetical protein
MVATRLSRFTGLVFVLAAIFSGMGAYDAGAEHGTGGSSTVADRGILGSASFINVQGESPAAFDFDWQ